MADEAETKIKYRVRDGFVLFPREGEPLEGGTEIELGEADAAYYAAQIELADPVLIAEAEKAEAEDAKAAAADVQ